MKRSDLNHLRRLVAWVRADIGQSPEELEATLRDIAEKLGHPDLDDEAKARLVDSHDRARRVPAYIRDAVKALEKYLQTEGDIVEDAEPSGSGRLGMEPRKLPRG